MDKLIHQIYSGFDRFPADLIGIHSREYDEARETCYSHYNELRDKLPVEVIDGFEKLLEAHLCLLSVGMEEGFISGFKLGAKLITEVYQEEK